MEFYTIFEEFLATNALNLIFGSIGILGVVLTYLARKESNSDKEAMRYLIDLAEKNIDKDVTEETLKLKKKEVEKTVEEIRVLQAKIENEIPVEAKRAVLLDRLEIQKNTLNQAYLQIQDIRGRLEAIGEEADLPDALLKAIASEISPEYLLKERRNEYRNYLTMATAFSAILSVTLPYPFSKFISGAVLVFIAGPVLYKLFLVSLPHDDVQRKYTVHRWSSIGYLILALTTACSALFTLIVMYYGESFLGFGVALATLLALATIITLKSCLQHRKAYKKLEFVPKRN